MALVKDTQGSGTYLGTGGSQTIASPTINGTLLLVAVWTNGGNGITVGTPSWNGTSMTLAPSASGVTGGTSIHWYVYYMLNPTTGTHNLTSTNTNGAGFGYMYISYTGNSSSQFDGNADSGSIASTSVSQALTPTNGSDIVTFWGFTGGDTTAAFSGAATNNQMATNAAGNSAGAYSGLFGDSGVVSPVSSQTGTLTGTSQNAEKEVYALAIKTATVTSSQPLSMSNSASRLVSLGTRAFDGTRTGTLTLMNAASRLVTVSWNYWFTRTLSVTAMTFSSILKGVGGIWKTLTESVSSWTNGNKSSTSWSNANPDSTSWTNQSKS